MKNKSLWEDNYKKNNLKIKNNISFDTDILIIGGGITGITTAYLLRNSNFKITLIDRGKIGMGISSKSTAKVSYLQGTIYQDLEKYFSKNISKLYLGSQLDAINMIKSIVDSEKIDCNLEKVDSFLFTTDEKNIKKIDKEKELLESFGIKCSDVDKLPIDFPFEKGFMVTDTYQMNPIKYVRNILKLLENDFTILENTTAFKIELDNDLYKVFTNMGVFKTKYVVMACHYPFFVLPGLIPIKNYMEREYVNAGNYSIDKPFTAINIDSELHSIRFYKNYLIYGSNKQRLTNKLDYQNQYQKSKDDFKKYFNSEPLYTWMNQDLITADYLPFIGYPDRSQPHLLIGTGYRAWGMTNGVIASKIISDLILEKKNAYLKLFSPTRKNLSLFTNSLIDSLFYAKIYLQTTFNKNPSFYPDSVHVFKINGKHYGMYIDSNEKKHIVFNKCPHFKCNLIFNKEEKTWDCPCHGSRFSMDGDVIEGPSTYSIRLENN